MTASREWTPPTSYNQHMPSLGPGKGKNLVTDLYKIIERQNREIASLRQDHQLAQSGCGLTGKAEAPANSGPELGGLDNAMKSWRDDLSQNGNEPLRVPPAPVSDDAVGDKSGVPTQSACQPPDANFYLGLQALTAAADATLKAGGP
eukprot:CAMPEP_0119298128 /NCGR_PEP_ID=MMETSP1333-20130426/337_1 /TAXON_ID=418940 /ORGANISM="Scyphosphaera apsteinii, Strain RCC1455" /LENGTH=146 /DNA_ID=CAMNT_0007299153 /DNA_START=23 /DNA_END=459 /DNA_ORIENTATION=+